MDQLRCLVLGWAFWVFGECMEESNLKDTATDGTYETYATYVGAFALAEVIGLPVGLKTNPPVSDTMRVDLR